MDEKELRAALALVKASHHDRTGALTPEQHRLKTLTARLHSGEGIFRKLIAILDDDLCSDALARTGARMLLYGNKHGENVSPSVNSLAGDLRKSPRTIQRRIDDLEKLGHIESVEVGTGRGNTNVYKFGIPPRMLDEVARGIERIMAERVTSESERVTSGDEKGDTQDVTLSLTDLVDLTDGGIARGPFPAESGDAMSEAFTEMLIEGMNEVGGSRCVARQST